MFVGTLPCVDVGTWIAIIAALVAIVALYFSGRSAHAADRAAKAAEKQTDIQEQLRIDAAQPYVWADVRPDDEIGQQLLLAVGNSGPTVATNVRVNVDPPLPTIDDPGGRASAALARLADGLQSLPPGLTLTWSLGLSSTLLNEQRAKAYTFTVTADGPFGAVPPLTYVVDMDDWQGMLDRPAGSLHRLTLAVKDLGKKISKQTVPNNPRRAQSE